MHNCLDVFPFSELLDNQWFVNLSPNKRKPKRAVTLFLNVLFLPPYRCLTPTLSILKEYSSQ